MNTIEEYIHKSNSVFETSFCSKMLAKYNTLPIPSKKLEDWKFFDATNWFQNTWNFNSPQQITQDQVNSIVSNISCDSVLVFENGKYIPEFSIEIANSISFQPLSKISQSLKNSDVLDTKTEIPYNKFEVANLLSATDGAFITIEKSKTPKHIVIISVISGNNSFSMLQNTITIESGAKINITEITVSLSNENSVSNNITSILCRENAECEYTSIQKLHANVSAVQSVLISQEKNSLVTYNSFPLSGSYIRSNVRIQKQGEQANTNLFGLFFPSKNEQFETYTWVNHNKPNCETNELFKGLANENGYGVFSGMIYVARDAQKTLAKQSNKNILLSETAKIHSKPQLEIYADDVSCNHGSTTGQINRDALWYMQARGIAPKDAIKLMLDGFISDVVEKISNEGVRDLINTSIKEKL
jgi:Fe-S cluster assembly protein SufD